MGNNPLPYIIELVKNPVFDTMVIVWFIHRCFKVYPELGRKFFE